MSHASERRDAVALSSLLLFACAALALANLPGDDLPPGWLCAFVLPGALLAQLTRFTPWPWQRALLAIALQTGACWLALELVGPMSRPAALACTILPPLGFATARHHEADQALALFLSFCVLLVGTILDGLCAPLIAAYGVCACLSLRCSNHLAMLAHGRTTRNLPTPSTARAAVAGALPLVVGSLLAVLAIERGLDWLPSPLRGSSRQPAAGGGPGAGERRVGLDDSFLLDGTRGVLSDLTGEQLVLVRDTAGRDVAPGLYLRSGFFTVPGLDRWTLGSLDLANGSTNDGHVLRRRRGDVPVQQFEFERFAGARNFVFVPPAAIVVQGLPDLVVDTAREWVRQRRASDTGPYLVDWQLLPPLSSADRIDPRARADGLLRLPRDFDAQRYEQLLTDWNVPPGTDALTAMQRIAAGLERRCRYDRIEPVGPWPNAIDNFLFAAGDRRGYCMHFASAAALLLRLRDIPCRIGVGLFGGDVDREEPHSRIYGSQHAHAWVEVPFTGRGYVVYDPTPAAERGQRMPSRLDTSGGDDAAAKAKAGKTEPSLGETLLAIVQQPWAIASLLMLALIASTWQRRPAAAAATAPPPAARSARRLLARMLQALAAAGHVRQRGETLELFARSLARRQGLAPAIDDALRCYQQVRFGGRPFDAERERTLRSGIDTAQAMAREAAVGKDLAAAVQPAAPAD